MEGKIIKVILLILLVIPLTACAFSFNDWFDDVEDWFNYSDIATSSQTQVINKVRVEANTGGNTASDGEIIEGKSEASVEIETIINGQSIEPINKKVESENGSSSISVEQKIVVPSDGEPQVERKIEINNVEANNTQIGTPEETQNESATENIENKETAKETLEAIEKWWADFVEGLKSFFASIFSIF